MKRCLATFVLSFLVFGCGEDATNTEDAMSAMDVWETPDVPDVVLDISPEDTGPPPECIQHDDCPSAYCDHSQGKCVECLIHAHCPTDAPLCTQEGCTAPAPCDTETPCETGVCDPNTTSCVDCLSDADCPENLICQNLVCSSEKLPCTEASNCSGYGLLCKPGLNLCVECLGDLHCPESDYCGNNGDCLPDACPPNLPGTNCDGFDLSICADNGSEWEAVPCPEGQACKDGIEGFTTGSCAPVVCEAGNKECSGFYEVTLCNATGTEEATYACPPSTICEAGECKIPKPIILVAFDTSSSMWAYPDGGVPEQCDSLGKTCVDPWPTCEGEQGGITYMGQSKSVFGALFSTFSDAIHFGLLRFPQTVLAPPQPICKSGYYQGQTTLTDDPDEHVASEEPDGWFQSGLPESLVVPIATTTEEDSLSDILSWLDFTETLEDLETPCAGANDCGPQEVCKSGSGGDTTCHVHSNPELRPVGQTPLGRTLFYAGEYLRQNVVVDGRSCVEDDDCGTPFHSCQEGVCIDPGRACRPLGIILFTDGTESVDPHLEDWFNPRNQAKRFFYGLGCSSDADCLSNATCLEGHCSPPGGIPSGESCLGTGQFCQSDGDCGDNGPCVSNENLFTDSAGIQRLLDPSGAPIALSVSVVTVGTSASDASLIAENGGGEFFQITDANPDGLLAALSTIVSQKLAADCSGN